ncbi:hypothetical protein HK097_011083, partial [Rhizophlyctis rosea]
MGPSKRRIHPIHDGHWRERYPVRMYDFNSIECISATELEGGGAKVLDFDRDGGELLVVTGESLQ